MAKRIQVVLSDSEFEDIERKARLRGTSISKYVREVLNLAGVRTSQDDVERKLAALRRAVSHSYPSGDMNQILKEIERGYKGGRRARQKNVQ